MVPETDVERGLPTQGKSGFDAILFDLDGVLVDSLGAIEKSMRWWAMERGLDPEDVLARSHGRRDEDLIRECAPSLTVETEIKLIEDFDVQEAKTVRPLPGARRVLRSLEAGSWAVITSGSRRVAAARMAGSGLPEPRCFVTAESVRRGKPFPDGYLLAADRLGAVPERCLVVEDAPAGLAAARAAGMPCLGVGAALAGPLPGLVGQVRDLDEVRVVTGPTGLRVLTGRSRTHAGTGPRERRPGPCP
ncbi:HAD-IA family hydrolase [Nocardiopsis tropica]|uniref:HAD-IA family hydrolase n=1 Tax=Nocardiopsis tropica TaxID=109330 RepID=A0ABU7KL86_9ACTN|nr:HAD-IA family hydrolase [Nocardiopsis umidischolae]MEE2050049.1 HAD-IA family hydrolase [Nocardiopsis umidischolae]